MINVQSFLSLLLAGILYTTQVQSSSDQVESPQPVYGAGPSTQIVALFFEHFSKRPEAKGVQFIVPERSTKHAGGIRASDEHLFGRTGRPLTEAERQLGKSDILLAKVPIGFVTGKEVKLGRLKFRDINMLFSGEIVNWKEMGGPDAEIVLVGREKTEAVLNALLPDFPSLSEAKYHQVLNRDHAVANMLSSPAGNYAIGFGALSNFNEMNIIQLEGPPLGVGVGLVVDNSMRNNHLVKAVEQYAQSMEWQQIAKQAGYFVSNVGS